METHHALTMVEVAVPIGHITRNADKQEFIAVAVSHQTGIAITGILAFSATHEHIERFAPGSALIRADTAKDINAAITDVAATRTTVRKGNQITIGCRGNGGDTIWETCGVTRMEKQTLCLNRQAKKRAENREYKFSFHVLIKIGKGLKG